MTATHSGVTGRALTRALQSLSDSTSLTVQVGGVEYRGERLRSPYLSHQSVSLSVDPTAPLLGIVLSNERFTVYAVGPLSGAIAHHPAPPAGMVWHEAAIPAALVRAVAGRLGALAPGLDDAVRGQLVVALPRPLGERHAPIRESVLVRAAVAMPILLGYDESGRPLFAEVPEPEPEPDPLAGITEATFDPADEPPAPADDDPEPEPEG